MKDIKKLSNILKLLDDESLNVRQCVLKELYCYGAELERDIESFYPEYFYNPHPLLKKVFDIYRNNDFVKTCQDSLNNNSFFQKIEDINKAYDNVEKTLYFPGTLIFHKNRKYRGVVVDIDLSFRSKKASSDTDEIPLHHQQPWYYVLVHKTEKVIYLPHSHIDYDKSGEQILHPLRDYFFKNFQKGVYKRNKRILNKV
ncbi:hypothetical protein AB834_00810 [PVC group bacterium (ex Bugula neritina AB1)]|nr:hypothetical protein AB834_00810 [PVC group bacterium (ex Bugula neritina AB1)]